MGIILILALSAYAASELLIIRYKETEEVHYTYKSKGNIDYKVYLKPNIMYDQKYLEKDRFYVFKYIDYVDMELKYEYTSGAAAGLKTEYSVTAYLQGLHGDENEVLWSKEYALVPDKTEQKEDAGIAIELKVPVNMDNFSHIKESLYLDSEVNAPVVLNIIFNIHTVASTKYGTVEDRISPNLVIPIGSSVFKMEGTPEAAGENKLVEKVKNQVPVDMRKVVFLFGASFVLLVAVVVVAAAKTAEPPDAFEKNIASIFKEYSERLAGMQHTIPYQFSDVINVSSIEDMVKIADEVGQPVFYYKVDSNIERKIEFFVFDNTRIYYMVLFGEIKPETGLLQYTPEKNNLSM